MSGRVSGRRSRGHGLRRSTTARDSARATGCQRPSRPLRMRGPLTARPHLAARVDRVRPHRGRAEARRPLARRGRRRRGSPRRYRSAGREDRRSKAWSRAARWRSWASCARRIRAPAIDGRRSCPVRVGTCERGAVVSGRSVDAGGGQHEGSGRSGGPGAPWEREAAPAASAASVQCRPDADLADLASIVGPTVRVGGWSWTCGPTASSSTTAPHAPVSLREAAADWVPLIEPGDAHQRDRPGPAAR